MGQIKIGIADDHQLYCEALGLMFEAHENPNFEVLFTVNNGHGLMSSLETHRPDLVLLDLNMPEMDGLTALPLVKQQYANVKVVVLTMYDQAKFIKSVFKQKGDGYFLKTNPFSELVIGIGRVLKGQTYLSNGLKVFPRNGGDAIVSSQFDDEFMIRYNLTPREIEILHLISQAKSNKEIAEDLFISDQTVGVHRKNIMRKLSVSNTAGLIKFAMDHDLS